MPHTHTKKKQFKLGSRRKLYLQTPGLARKAVTMDSVWVTHLLTHWPLICRGSSLDLCTGHYNVNLK